MKQTRRISWICNRCKALKLWQLCISWIWILPFPTSNPDIATWTPQTHGSHLEPPQNCKDRNIRLVKNERSASTGMVWGSDWWGGKWAMYLWMHWCKPSISPNGWTFAPLAWPLHLGRQISLGALSSDRPFGGWRNVPWQAPPQSWRSSWAQSVVFSWPPESSEHLRADAQLWWLRQGYTLLHLEQLGCEYSAQSTALVAVHRLSARTVWWISIPEIQDIADASFCP